MGHGSPGWGMEGPPRRTKEIGNFKINFRNTLPQTTYLFSSKIGFSNYRSLWFVAPLPKVPLVPLVPLGPLPKVPLVPSNGWGMEGPLVKNRIFKLPISLVRRPQPPPDLAMRGQPAREVCTLIIYY